MSHDGKAQVDSLKKLGIATSRIMAHMAGQSGGYRMLRYTRTEKDRLGSLLWADEQMMADYQLFGDVFAFD
ncbi:hypothetical protein AHAS_Ahas16G0189700 [Arachis hypogaea]